jgi:hypothetical protein
VFVRVFFRKEREKKRERATNMLDIGLYVYK